jgi:hypothetical protein
MVKSPESLRMKRVSPTRSSREGLAGMPLAVIRPRSQAWEASERVLKKRAAQSHLSILTLRLSYGLAMPGQTVSTSSRGKLAGTAEWER